MASPKWTTFKFKYLPGQTVWIIHDRRVELEDVRCKECGRLRTGGYYYSYRSKKTAIYDQRVTIKDHNNLIEIDEEYQTQEGYDWHMLGHEFPCRINVNNIFPSKESAKEYVSKMNKKSKTNPTVISF